MPAVPAAASFFATYEAIKGDANLRSALGDGAALSSVAALGGESVSCVVRVPAEQLKMRMQATHDATFAAAVRTVRAQGGWGALYKGLGATLMLDLPFSFIQFPLFEGLKVLLAMPLLTMSTTRHATNPYHNSPCHDLPCYDSPCHYSPWHDSPCHDSPRTSRRASRGGASRPTLSTNGAQLPRPPRAPWLGGWRVHVLRW